MKKAPTRLLFVILIAAMAGCGGGSRGGSATHATGKTTVSIAVGQTKTKAKAGGLIKALSSIPESVADMRITVSAPDMPMIERIIAVSGATGMSESFDVPNGSNRLFSLEALDNNDYVLYRGSAYADLDGVPVKLGITMVSSDPLPPVFQGLSGISQITETSLVLSWQEATDEVTLSEKIQYLIYMSTTPGGENFGTPTFTTEPGVTSFNVTGLNPRTIYYFVVRPMDEGGNVGTNNLELSANTLAPSDVSPPVFEGLASATASSSSAAVLGWKAATDDVSPPSKTVYLVYMATTPGGENFASPNFMATGTTSFSVDGLNSGATYYFMVRARDEAGNTDSNVVERSVTIPLPPDTVPPQFSGLLSARASSSTRAVLSWQGATDDVTSTGNIVYLVYMATKPGGENFTSPSYTTTRGTTSFTAGGLSQNTTYYFVVRAEDEAGNIDSNIIEKSVRTPADVTAPVFSGGSLTSQTSTSITLGWTAATDNLSSSSNISYLIYLSTKPCGESFTTPSYVTAPGATSYTITGVNPLTTIYYFVVRARDGAGNIESNIQEHTSSPPCTYDFSSTTPVYNSVTGMVDFNVINTGYCGAVNLTVWVQYGGSLSGCVPVTVSTSALSYIGYGTCAWLTVKDPVSVPVPMAPFTTRVMLDPANVWTETNKSNNCSDDSGGIFCATALPATCP